MKKRITFTLMGFLLLLGGAKVCAQTETLYLNGGQNWNATDGTNSWGSYLGSSVTYTAGDVTINEYGRNLGMTGLTGSNWCAPFTEGEIHTFKIELNEAPGNDHFELVGGTKQWGSFEQSTDLIVSVIGATDTEATLVLDHNYDGVYLLNNTASGETIKIKSITRTVTSGGGGGGSALDGKTAVTYNIPGKNVIFSDSFDSNIEKWGRWNEEDGSVDWDSTTGHDSNGCMKVVNNSSRNSDQWKIQRHADFSQISSGTTFYVTFYIKCESGTGSIRCSTTGHAQYQGDQNVSTAWQQIIWEVTAEGDIDGFCLDMAHTANTYYIDDVEVYTNAATGGSNVFTSDEQVANIASSAFTNLTAGDYICADVTGTPATIKIACNGTDYALTQFNGGTLWGIKATAEMVAALQANNSQFKGHDLTLNDIVIYQTKAINEGNNDLTVCNNVFVELTRSFVANTWNTVCLPFVPTAEQATALFGNGYKLAEFTGVSESTMEFTTTNTFAAGVPYLVKPTASKAVTSPTVFDNVNITATTASSVEQTDGGDTYKFAGTFAPKTFAGNECATSRFVAAGNKLNTPTDGSTMKALRAYFTVPASTNNARNFTIDGFEDEVITSISEEQIVKGETSSSVIYNLAGQRVAQPTKGLYIVNGKKVLVKDKR